MTNATTDTTTATESQHPRTNEGACESEVEMLREELSSANITIGFRDGYIQRLERELQKRVDESFEIAERHNQEIYEARRALAAEQAAHALARETYSIGAEMNAAQVKQLREQALLAEAVRDSHKARITELCDAVKAERECEKAERECEKALGTANFGMEWRAFWNAKALTDMLVRKHAGAGVVDEAITSEALEREGWERYESRGAAGPSIRYTHKSQQVWVTLYSGAVAVCVHDGIFKNSLGATAENCHTMRDINTLVRLLTAPDAARARDEG